MFHRTLVQGTEVDDGDIRPRDADVCGRPTWDTAQEQPSSSGGGDGGGAPSGSYVTLAGKNRFERRQSRTSPPPPPQPQFFSRCIVDERDLRIDVAQQQRDEWIPAPASFEGKTPHHGEATGGRTAYSTLLQQMELSDDALFGGSGGHSRRNSLRHRQIEAVPATRRYNPAAHSRGSAVPAGTPPSGCCSCSCGAHPTGRIPHSRVDADDCHEQQRATLTAIPANGRTEQGCRLRHDKQELSGGAPLVYRQHEALVDERRQGVDRGQSEGIRDFTINTHPPGFGSRREHSINRVAASYPSGGDARGGTGSAFSGRKSSSDRSTSEHQRLAGGILSGSGSQPPIGAPASNDGGGGNAPVAFPRPPWSPRAAPSSTAVSTPRNPQQWLNNFELRQSSSVSGGGGAASLECLPPSVLSLASNSRISNVVVVGGGGGVTSAVAREDFPPGLAASLLPHVEGRVVAVGVCPAADCPVNGDCLPGATPEMLVYEMNFKRATRTFLPAEKLKNESILCGALMKVSTCSVKMLHNATYIRTFTAVEKIPGTFSLQMMLSRDLRRDTSCVLGFLTAGG